MINFVIQEGNASLVSNNFYSSPTKFYINILFYHHDMSFDVDK